MSELYRQVKSGMFHLVYMNRTNCNRYKDANWKNNKIFKLEELPYGAKVCKKCLTNNK